jgi:hypothetical protein
MTLMGALFDETQTMDESLFAVSHFLLGDFVHHPRTLYTSQGTLCLSVTP